MKGKKIIIAGGTGFIGLELIKYFSPENQIIVLTRKLNKSKTNRNQELKTDELNYLNTEYIKWDSKTPDGWEKKLNGADILINLTGKSVNCRYNEENKNEIINSRVDSTKILGEAIRNLKAPPSLWINSSSATIYRNAFDHPQDEHIGEIENDFSVQVCKFWESAFFDQQTPGTRKVALRMAINIGPGGIFIPYFNLLKLGLGGRQGSGKQMYSWIHIEDTCRIITWLWDHPEMQGIYNASSPNPVTNTVFMKTLRKLTNHKIGLPAFEWMLKLGAPFIGTETELVLKSRWVLPTKMLQSGFQFKYPHLEQALKNIVEKVPRKQYHLF